MEHNADPGYDSGSDVDANEAIVRAPREQWRSEMPIPAVHVANVHAKTGLARSAADIEGERQTKTLRAMRDERVRIGKALPQPAQPEGVVGGAHDLYENWSPDEDEALLRILPLNKFRPCWAEIALALTMVTKKERSKKSVRCRWARLRTGRLRSLLPEGDPKRSTKRCRVCGLLKRGHVCPGPSTKPRTVDQMLIGVHQAIAAKRLAAESSDEEGM